MADTQHRIKLDGEIYIQPRRQKDNFILRRIDGNSKLLFSRKKKRECKFTFPMLTEKFLQVAVNLKNFEKRKRNPSISH